MNSQEGERRMNYYTADIHFNSIRNLSYRPFDTVEEMNKVLLTNINDRVSKKDTLYIVGDVGSISNPPFRILHKIRCRMVLIVGNNDVPLLKNRKFTQYFSEIYFGNYLVWDEDIKNKIFLNHYPCVSWNGSRTGIPHFYGHIHSLKTDGYEQMKQVPNAYNIGVDVLDYMPRTAREIIEVSKDS